MLRHGGKIAYFLFLFFLLLFFFLNIVHMLICVNLLRIENEKNDFKCLLCIY